MPVSIWSAASKIGLARPRGLGPLGDLVGAFKHGRQAMRDEALRGPGQHAVEDEDARVGKRLAERDPLLQPRDKERVGAFAPQAPRRPATMPMR